MRRQNRELGLTDLMISRIDGLGVPKGDATAERGLEGRPYLAAIDGLRAVAVVAVMLFH